MCGIVGIFRDNEAKIKVEAALKLLKKRGKDGHGIQEIPGEGVLGHTLHAVVGKVAQPLKGKGILVANCEIYNWRELSEKYSLPARNDAELLLKFLDAFGVEEARLNELDGVYAFAYFYQGRLFLSRDILGEKPLWVSLEKGLAFASEKKVLEKLGYELVHELHPRQILQYDGKVNFSQRAFFTCLPEWKQSAKSIRDRTAYLLEKAIIKRIPATKFGLLFSGGVDSTLIAKILKDLGQDFTCYTGVLDNEDPSSLPSDLIYSLKAAETLNLKLKIKKIKIDQIPLYLQKIVPLIEDSNVVKNNVALPLFLACDLAEEDGCKVIFSGLGSEEIFAGYERHKLATNLNLECLSGLRKIFERDLYRDDLITMQHGLELRLPFLDQELVSYALKIPSKHKIDSSSSKKILREIALQKGVPPEIALRKKTAAQYGSRFASALEKVAKRNGFPSQSTYLKTFYPRPNLRLGVLFSSGKDSATAAYILQQQNYELSCLITMKSSNPDSYMFQEAGTELVELQAQAMGIPLILQNTAGEKERELVDLSTALQRAKDQYEIEGVVTGALSSTYQRDRIEQVCEELGLKVFSPLWHKSQENHLRELLAYGFKAVITRIAAEGLTEVWLGREIDSQAIEELGALAKKKGINPAGEGGEIETLVLTGPLFKKKIVLKKTSKEMNGPYSGKLIIEEAFLQ